MADLSCWVKGYFLVTGSRKYLQIAAYAGLNEEAVRISRAMMLLTACVPIAVTDVEPVTWTVLAG